ncbi:hypothetical protein F5884DRAFT_891092 [Xylogone sp. PMI_703]|nr:hypothetical protein F5884DRAFT_891092 [Xylogone sp. PMI_703]
MDYLRSFFVRNNNKRTGEKDVELLHPEVNAMSQTIAPLETVVAPIKPTQKEIDEKPWKYLGYNAFSSYLVADPDNLVVRRFNKLFGRGILYMQDQLSELETKLEELDKRYRDTGPGEREYDNGTARNDLPDRKALVDEIVKTQYKYYKMILMYSQVGAWEQSKPRSIQNVKNWFSNHPGAIGEEETQFINKSDLISIVKPEKSFARRWFEDWVIFRFEPIRKFFLKAPEDGLDDVDRETRKSVSDERLDTFASFSILLFGLILFVLPLWILQAIDVFRTKLGVITIFTVLFMVILTYSTSGKPFEILAVTAGYAAILVVFLQFGSPQAGQ